MESDMEISKLDISKNLLQMNFMKRTLIALERLKKPDKREELPSVADFQFSMPRSVVDVLSQRLEAISRRPVVRHVPGRIGVANFGLRASYGGFNSYLSEKSNSNSTALVKEGEEKKKGKNVGTRRRPSDHRSPSNRKRKSHGKSRQYRSNHCMFLFAAEYSPAPAKRTNRKHSP
ncbi:hypothetical protein EGR_09387 [Echinococcus granulosus]|uniref:Uncharacterized protein n=1 Tax=Echinococcus granulosus TaxID=6210 RepID=W6UQM8_ECHGR|nr:hypothetical protein EGR_09387 [Echinococcus granulosus]EUB55729.1 hypothetical protein EGR_09387 [Echinococcus granulosus]